MNPEAVQDDPAVQNSWRHGEVIANGVQLHYVEAGNPDGELVLLLHGFPECWYSWRLQIGPLADTGRRVIALDLPGFGQSDKPAGVRPIVWIPSRPTSRAASIGSITDGLPPR